MNYGEVLIILLGAIALVWVLVALNTFVSGNPFFMYLGTPVVFGIGAIVGGGFFTYFVYHNYT